MNSEVIHRDIIAMGSTQVGKSPQQLSDSYRSRVSRILRRSLCSLVDYARCHSNGPGYFFVRVGEGAADGNTMRGWIGNGIRSVIGAAAQRAPGVIFLSGEIMILVILAMLVTPGEKDSA